MNRALSLILSASLACLGIFPASTDSQSFSGRRLLNFNQPAGATDEDDALDDNAGIYIPADKRHQGLSRFDVLPFTDRRRGDPDRYRAVNPNYVKKENDDYYFALDVKPGTHCYDENLTDKGILSETNVEVDLTRTKTEKNADGDRNVRYVYVKAKGYVRADALRLSLAEIRAGRWFQFPLETGKEHELYDGNGIARGKIAAASTRLNYGQTKQIAGEKHYYAFSTKIRVPGSSSGETIGASGWIKASAIEGGHDPHYDRRFTEKMQLPTPAGDQFTEYEITGGDPQETDGTATTAAGKLKYKFGFANEKGEFVAYKVLPKIPLAGNQSVATTDYLKRGDNVINLGFNVAGVSNDTFRLDGQMRPLVFHRSHDPHATAVIDLFYPKDAARDGEKIVEKMIFVYGFVATSGGGKRWGWMPLGALRLKS